MRSKLEEHQVQTKTFIMYDEVRKYAPESAEGQQLKDFILLMSLLHYTDNDLRDTVKSYIKNRGK